MADFLHFDLGDLGSDEAVEVQLDKRASIRLLDDSNLSKYRRGQRYEYHGGQALRSPMRLRPPRSAHWHLVIDLGGNAGRVRATVSTLRC